MRWGLAIIGCTMTVGALAQVPSGDDQRRRAVETKQQAAAASTHADALAMEAGRERTAAALWRARREVASARVAEAAAKWRAGQAQVELADRLLDDQRASLSAGETPVTRLLGALAALTRRPVIAAIAQPGSADDLVHVRAVFGAVLPAIRARTAALRSELAKTRALREQAARAATALAADRAVLEQTRTALAQVEQAHVGRAIALGRNSLNESDRAIALGEQARDIIEQIALAGGQQATLAELRTLPGPPGPTRHGGAARPTYQLPVAGRLVTGFGELSPVGVRSRGLTLAPRPGAIVLAPASGRVTFAGNFRKYGPIVIINHGAGWTTLVAGLSRVTVRAGGTIMAETPIGRGRVGADTNVTVELRRRGRPVNPAALL